MQHPPKIENSAGESRRGAISRVKSGALNVYRAESRTAQRFAKIFREPRGGGNAEPRRGIRSSAARRLISHTIYPGVYSSYYAGRSIVPARVSGLGVRRLPEYTRVAGKANAPRERAKKAGKGTVCSSKGKPVRRTTGTSSRGNPAYLLRGTGKHVGMKEVWLPFRARRAAARRGKY